MRMILIIICLALLIKTWEISRMILDNFFKNLLYEPVSVLGILVFYFLLINLPISLGAVFKKKSSAAVRLITILVNLLITLQLLFRWSISGHFPISNLYESLYFLTWGITLGQLLIEREYQAPIIPSIAILLSYWLWLLLVLFYPRIWNYHPT